MSLNQNVKSIVETPQRRIQERQTCVDRRQLRIVPQRLEELHSASANFRSNMCSPGFKTAEVPSVTVSVTETPVLDRSLEVGQQSEQVTVEESAAVLQAATSTLGTTVGTRTVTDLPLASRNYTQIIGLSAGASMGVNNATTFGKGTLDMSVNGNDPGQNNFQMDGVAINNRSWSMATI